MPELPLLTLLDHRTGRYAPHEQPERNGAAGEFICPGESYTISKSVHLARLAAGHPGCEFCRHAPSGQNRRSDAKAVLTPLGPRGCRFTPEGVRARYVNTIDRMAARSWAQAVAGYWWDEVWAARRPGKPGNLSRRNTPDETAPPRVVVGRDDRLESLDISEGFVEGLQISGCHVVEIGPILKPAWMALVGRHAADGGVYVTGAGFGPAWTGFDLSAPEGVPLTGQVFWDNLSQRLVRPTGRPCRSIGHVQTIDGVSDYERGLRRYFHALRPLHVVIGHSRQRLGQLIERVFVGLPCTIHLVPLSVRERDLSNSADPDIQQIGDTVRQQQSDVGIVIGEDGQTLAVINERGRIVPGLGVSQLLAFARLKEEPRAAIVVENAALSSLGTHVVSLGGQCIDGGSSTASMAQAMQRANSALGLGATGRYWVRESGLVCDAMVSLAKLLGALSLSDRPCSEAIARRPV